MKVLRHKIELLTGTARPPVPGAGGVTQGGPWGGGAGVARAASPAWGWSCPPPAPPLPRLPQVRAAGSAPLRAPGGEARLQRGKPGPGVLGKGGTNPAVSWRRGRPADSRGWGCPGGRWSIPAVPPRSSASLPWESPRCPDECAGLGRRLLLATATARQPEPPPSPLLPPPPPGHPSVAPCARPGGSRGVAARSCTPQSDHTVRLVRGGCWVRTCVPHGARESCGCSSCTGGAGCSPDCVTLGFSFTPLRSPVGPAQGAMLWAHGRGSD